ncbi:hypothetical protein ACR0ST_09355, partial [Aliidiomarina sp. Khilg15.8]
NPSRAPCQQRKCPHHTKTWFRGFKLLGGNPMMQFIFIITTAGGACPTVPFVGMWFIIIPTASRRDEAE